MIKNTTIIIGLDIVRSDSGLGHTRKRTDTFLFWWGYRGILRQLVGE